MMITLLDGRTVELADIEFNAANYSFTLNGTDITKQIRNVDKRRFDGFDNEFYNNLLYVQKYQRDHGGALPPNVGSTSFWANFVQQILTDPLDAPLDTFDAVVDRVLDSPGVKSVLIIGGIVLVLVIIAKR